jgi:hypothetical protein
LGAFEKRITLLFCIKRAGSTKRPPPAPAIADDPNFSHGIGTVSWIFRSMGLTGEAVELARRAVETSGGNPWLVCNLAACLARRAKPKRRAGFARS